MLCVYSSMKDSSCLHTAEQPRLMVLFFLSPIYNGLSLHSQMSPHAWRLLTSSRRVTQFINDTSYTDSVNTSSPSMWQSALGSFIQSWVHQQTSSPPCGFARTTHLSFRPSIKRSSLKFTNLTDSQPANSSSLVINYPSTSHYEFYSLRDHHTDSTVNSHKIRL